jgi:putative two-component system response regulator
MEANKKIVFLVDDDLTNLTVGKKALSDSFKVFTMDSGEAMLEMVKNIKPDIVLLDISMPQMDGYEVLRRIREIEDLEDVPVIFLTGLNDSTEIMKGISLGPADYITKPFLTKHLLERVKAHISGR